MPPGNFEKKQDILEIFRRGGGGLQTPKVTLDTAFNMRRSSLSILNKLMLIMFMVFPLCGYV